MSSLLESCNGKIYFPRLPLASIESSFRAANRSTFIAMNTEGNFICEGLLILSLFILLFYIIYYIFIVTKWFWGFVVLGFWV